MRRVRDCADLEVIDEGGVCERACLCSRTTGLRGGSSRSLMGRDSSRVSSRWRTKGSKKVGEGWG
jgi:hypothetical protein